MYKNIAFRAEIFQGLSFIAPPLVAQTALFPLDTLLRNMQTGAMSACRFNGLLVSIWHLLFTKLFDYSLGTNARSKINEKINLDGKLPPSVSLGIGLLTAVALRYSLMYPIDTLTKQFQVSTNNSQVWETLKSSLNRSYGLNLYKGIQYGLPRTLILSSATFPVINYLNEETDWSIPKQFAVSTCFTAGVTYGVYGLDKKRTRAQTAQVRKILPKTAGKASPEKALQLRNPVFRNPFTGCPKRVAVLGSLGYSAVFNMVFHGIKHLEKKR